MLVEEKMKTICQIKMDNKLLLSLFYVAIGNSLKNVKLVILDIEFGETFLANARRFAVRSMGGMFVSVRCYNLFNTFFMCGLKHAYKYLYSSV